MQFISDFLIEIGGAVVLSGLGLLLFRVVVPWYQALVYHGPTIEGQWVPYDSPSDTDNVGTATIEQKATTAKMTLTRTRSRSGKAINRTFIYEGRFVEGQLVLLFEEKAVRGFITGTMVLRLSGDGKQFLGKSTYYDHDENSVVARDICLKRLS